jgi:DNA-binding NarL/FixJ family response regulator
MAREEGGAVPDVRAKPGGQAVRVLTVDDHPGFLAAAREVIAATPGFEVVGEAAGPGEAMEAVERLHPELVVLDVRMPGMSGMEVARRISKARPDTVVLLVSSTDHDDAAQATVACGASAFVRKERLRPALLQRVWTLHAPPSAR